MTRRRPDRTRDHVEWVQPGLMADLTPGEPPGWPPYIEHDGRRVTWRNWDEVPYTTHIDWECDSCGNRRSEAGPYERPWTCMGLIHPNDGETFRVDVEHPSKRIKTIRPPAKPGGLPRVERPSWVREEDVPAWPVYRLIAYWCGRCGEIRVYDVHGGDDGRTFTEVLVTLLGFDDE